MIKRLKNNGGFWKKKNNKLTQIIVLDEFHSARGGHIVTHVGIAGGQVRGLAVHHVAHFDQSSHEFLCKRNVWKIIFIKNMPNKECKGVRNIEWPGNFSEGALCKNSRSLWPTHETQGSAHKHRALSHATTLYGFPVGLCLLPAVRNVTFVNRILDGNIKWSTPSGMWKCDTVRSSIPPLANFLFFSKIGFI